MNLIEVGLVADSAVQLAKAVAVQDSRITTLEKIVCGNGKPSIEERMFSYMATMKRELRDEIDKSARHGKSNMQEGDGLVLAELARERQDRERQHQENKDARAEDKADQDKVIEAITTEMKAIGKKTDRNTNVVLAVGLAFTILTALKDFGIIHVVGQTR